MTNGKTKTITPNTVDVPRRRRRKKKLTKSSEAVSESQPGSAESAETLTKPMKDWIEWLETHCEVMKIFFFTILIYIYCFILSRWIMKNRWNVPIYSTMLDWLFTKFRFWITVCWKRLAFDMWAVACAFWQHRPNQESLTTVVFPYRKSNYQKKYIF